MAIYRVSPLGSNTAPYGTWETAANLPQTAVTHGNSVAGPHTLYIAPGSYASTLIADGANWANATIIGVAAHGSETEGQSSNIVITAPTNYALKVGAGQIARHFTLKAANATYSSIYAASGKSLTGADIVVKDSAGIGIDNAGTIVIDDLEVKNSIGVGINNSGTLTINKGLIKNGTDAAITAVNGTFTGNNLNIIGNKGEAAKIQAWANAATVVTLNNPNIIANAYGAVNKYVLDNTVGGATLTVNNGNIHGNPRVVDRRITDYYTRGATINNSIAKIPKFKAPKRKGILVLGVDDSVNIATAETLAGKLDAVGLKLSYTVDEDNATSLGYWPRIAALANAGHEIMSHTKSHSNLTDLTGISFTYSAGTSGNASATISFANGTLTAVVTGGSAGHGFIKAVAGMKLTHVISWVNDNYGALSDGASWTASGGTWTATQATNIADAAGVNCFGTAGALPLDMARYYDHEIVQSKGAIGALISANGGPANYQVQTIVFPGEYTDANVRASAYAAGYLGARGMYNADYNMSTGVRKFHVSSFQVEPSVSTSNIERNISTILEWLNDIGGITFIWTHFFTSFTAANWDTLIESIVKSNVDVMTMTEAINWLTTNGVESGAAGELSYSVSFTDSDDYHLLPTSPCIGAGVAVTGVDTDIEGNQLFSPRNIGPYGGSGVVMGVAISDFTGRAKKSLIESSPGVFEWPVDPELIAVTGVDNSVFNADGTGKTFATPALALAALETVSDDEYLFVGENGAVLYPEDKSAKLPQIQRAGY